MVQIFDADKRQLIRYGEVKIEMRQLTKEMDDLKSDVRNTLVRVGAEDTPVDIGIGTFSLRPRRTWKYTPELEAEMAEVKKKQKLQEATGQATFDITYDVYFK